MAENETARGDVKFINNIDSALEVMADPDHTYRIFHNLLRNAVQAMQESDEKTLTVAAKTLDNKIEVHITDTGPGLPQEVKGNLFKAFSSGVRKGGTGLGLTIARELARAQGGNLRLEKTGKNGTVFVVELPSI